MATDAEMTAMKRRQFLARSAAAFAVVTLRPVHALATANVLAGLVRSYAGSGTVTEGRVQFRIDPLVENGNSVPVEVLVDSPMTTAQHVVGIAIFNEKNPEHDVGVFTLSPFAGRARVATRIRLASSQQLIAVAKMNDGSCWTKTVEVLVTVSSCIEE